MTVPAVLRDVAQIGAYAAGRGRHAGLLVAVLLLAGCPGGTVGPEMGGPDASANLPRLPAAPPVPKAKPVRKMPELATLEPSLPLPQPGPPVTAGDLASIAPDPVSAPAPAPALTPAPIPAAVGAPSTPPATTNADPDSLVGLDEVQTLNLLGSPVAREEAPPAKIWRYAKGDCTLKVYFFMDMTSSQDFRALSYDMKSSQNVPDADHRCFAQLLAQADTGRPARTGVQ
ncbi:hypothetical protein [Azospirillum picis]|uniref:Uncharacterized protein n=1 Tax=Azospirillum picis TaxID=488438 RepID=A0ABU0MSZ4_9PROT|nr:hypothetical protein [Azospirillum picis]MBP2302887.1 hypothetical protein [Azospirillum picis]MDQ0536608.1 hypothetical protein [Azospirillum picis]